MVGTKNIVPCSHLQDENAKAGKFGFPVDNTIGGTPQENGWMDSWVSFFRERRLKPQLKRTNDAKLQQMGQQLMDNLDHFFDGVEVRLIIAYAEAARCGSKMHRQGQCISMKMAACYRDTAMLNVPYCRSDPAYCMGTCGAAICQQSRMEAGPFLTLLHTMDTMKLNLACRGVEASPAASGMDITL